MANGVSDVMVVDDVVLITLTSLPRDIQTTARVFDAVAKAGVNVDMICQTPPYRDVQDLSFTVGEAEMSRVLTVVSDIQKNAPGVSTDVNAGNTKLAFCGEMRDLPGVASGIFQLLAERGVGVRLITTSERTVSVLVDAQDVDKALDAAKEQFNIA